MTSRNLFCSIVGVPNMGKSTLLNKLIGFDLAIISPKAETTRNRITGVLTTEDGIQYVFFDTPGFNKPKTKLDVHLVKMVRDTYNDVDLALFLTEPYPDFTDRELRLLDELKQRDVPVILVVNKIDRVAEEAEREKILRAKTSAWNFAGSLCVSALDGTGLDRLMEILSSYAVEGEHFFPDDTLTDMPEKYVVAELIRERLLFNLRDELPHGCAVEVLRFREREDNDLVDIDVNILCERDSHKGMIIGKKGAMLKKIGSEARARIEDFLQCRVNLQCWVKVRDGWRDNEKDIRDLGY
jgi:GTP-binding protein Era